MLRLIPGTLLTKMPWKQMFIPPFVLISLATHGFHNVIIPNSDASTRNVPCKLDPSQLFREVRGFPVGKIADCPSGKPTTNDNDHWITIIIIIG